MKLGTFQGPVADKNLSDMGTKSDTGIPKWAKNLATSNMDYEKVVTSILEILLILKENGHIFTILYSAKLFMFMS